MTDQSRFEVVSDDQAGKRQLPHNQEAEKSVLGGIFIKPAAFDEIVTILQVDDFFQPAHREIFEVMIALNKRQHPVDVLAVADELRVRGMISRLEGGESYLLALSNSVPTAENVGHYSRLVKEKAILRRLIAVCAEMQARAYGDFGEFGTFISEFHTATASVEAKLGDAPVRMGSIMSDALDVIERRAKDPTRFFVRTGLRGFDRSIGGYQREDLVVVAAPPGCGKTAWAVNNVVIASALVGVPNLVISQEMSTQQLIERAIGSVAGGKVATRDIHRGNLSKDAWTHVWEAAKKLTAPPIDVYETAADIEGICSQARRWAAKVRAELPPAADGLPALLNITIDYIQIVQRRVRRGASEAELISDITRGSKALARELKCPVTALSQLNNEAIKDVGKDGKPRRPRLTDLKGSGSISQDADKVLFLVAEDAPHPKPGDLPITQTDAEIIVAKNRSGPTGTIPCRWERRTMTFLDASPHEPEWETDRRVPD